MELLIYNLYYVEKYEMFVTFLFLKILLLILIINLNEITEVIFEIVITNLKGNLKFNFFSILIINLNENLIFSFN